MAYLDYWTLAFLFETIITFFAVLNINFKTMNPAYGRLSVLSVRTAFFLPAYSFLIYISLLEPAACVGLVLPITMIEGYVFYCFAALIVTNLGGPEGAIAILNQHAQDPLCACSCCPCYKSHEEDPKAFYLQVSWAVFHFSVTRSFLALLGLISYYTHTDAGDAFYKIFTCASALLLLYAIITFVLFFEKVYEQSKNLFAVGKLALIKVSVGLITMGLLVTTFIATSGASDYNDDSQFNAEQKLVRVYCASLLVIFSIMSIAYFVIYGVTIRPPAETTSMQAIKADSLGAFMWLVFGNWLDVVDQLNIPPPDELHTRFASSKPEDQKPDEQA